MEAAPARAPKSASRTWVKFEIGHPPLLSPSPLDGASHPHACYLRSFARSTAVHLSRVLARPPTSPSLPPSPMLARRIVSQGIFLSCS